MLRTISFITLGVQDVNRAMRFYRQIFETDCSLEDGLALFKFGDLRLAIYSRQSLADDIGVSSEGNGFSGLTASINVAQIEDVDQTLNAAKTAGGSIVKFGHAAEWGGYSGYFSDPDGFYWEVAWNPKLNSEHN